MSVSCRQQGDLLLVLRSRYANLCNKLSKVRRPHFTLYDLYFIACHIFDRRLIFITVAAASVGGHVL